jgi:hypothetical protein
MNKKIGILGALALVSAIVAFLVVPVLATPGDANDPLVTRRYVDDRIAELSAEIALLRNILATVAPGTVPGTVAPAPDATAPGAGGLGPCVCTPGAGAYYGWQGTWTVLNAAAGGTIIFEGGADFIVRSGGANAISTNPFVGIPDLTAGVDVLNGQAIGLNHLMMVPQTDGRGITFTESSWIMIRGAHTVQ